MPAGPAVWQTPAMYAIEELVRLGELTERRAWEKDVQVMVGARDICLLGQRDRGKHEAAAVHLHGETFPFMFWDRSIRILRRAMITSLLPLEEPLQLQQELPSSVT